MAQAGPYEEGRYHYDAARYEKARPKLESAARDGKREGQYLLGLR
jgi:hypothetical protein